MLTIALNLGGPDKETIAKLSYRPGSYTEPHLPKCPLLSHGREKGQVVPECRARERESAKTGALGWS